MKYSDWQLDFFMIIYEGYFIDIYCGLSLRWLLGLGGEMIPLRVKLVIICFYFERLVVLPVFCFWDAFGL